MTTTSTRNPWIAIAAAAGAAAIVAAVVVLRARTPEIPTSDRAVTELYTLRAARLDLSVGAYSRFGWNHPGPLFFYLAAPLYAASGRRYAAIALTALVVNVVSLVAIGAILRRHAPPAATLALAAALGLYAWRFDDLATSAWNPHVGLLPLALLVVASAAAAAGRLSMLPLVCATFSFVVQAHVAFVVPAAACVVVAAVVWLAARRHEVRPAAARWTRPVGASILVLAMVWLPPIWDQLAGERNLGQLVTFFASDAPRHELNRSVAVFGHEFTTLVEPRNPALDAALSRGSAGPKALRGWAAVSGIEIALLLALAAGAVRSGRPFDAALAGSIAVASLAAVPAIMRIRGAIEPYLVGWVGVLGTMALGVLSGAVLRRTWSPVGANGRLRAAADALLLLVCAGVLTAGLARVFREPIPQSDGAAVYTLSTAAATFLDAHPGKPVIRVVQGAWPVAAGIVLQLTKAGRPVAVERDWASMFGRPFRETAGDIPFIVADEEFSRTAVRTRGGLELLAHENGVYLWH